MASTDAASSTPDEPTTELPAAADPFPVFYDGSEHNANDAIDFAAAFYEWSTASRVRLETVVDRKTRFGEDLWYGELLDALRTDVVPQLSADGTLDLEDGGTGAGGGVAPFHVGVPLIGSHNDPSATMFALAVDPLWEAPRRTIRLLPNVPWLVAEHTWASAATSGGAGSALVTVWGAPSAGFLEELCVPGAPEAITIELSREIGAGAVVETVRRLAARRWDSDAPVIAVDIRPGGASNAERKKAADVLRAELGSRNAQVRVTVDPRIDHPEPVAYGVDWFTASQHLKEPDLLAEVASSPGDPLRARLETRPGSNPGAPQRFRGEVLPRPSFDEIAYVFCATDPDVAVDAMRRFAAKHPGSFYPATPLTLAQTVSDNLASHLDRELPVVVVACPGDAVVTRIALEQLPPRLRVNGFVTSHEEATELHANAGLPAHICSQTYSGTQGFRNPSGVRELRDKLSRQRELLREFDEARAALGAATESGAHPLAGLITPLRNHQLNRVRARKLELPEEEISPWPGLLVSRADRRIDGFTLLRGFLPGAQRGLTLALPPNEPDYVTSCIRSNGPNHQTAWALNFGTENAEHLRSLLTQVRPTEQLEILIGRGRNPGPIVDLVRSVLVDGRYLAADTSISVTFSNIHSPGHADAAAKLVRLAAIHATLSVRAKALHPLDRRLLAPAATPEQRRAGRAQTWQRDLLPTVFSSALRAVADPLPWAAIPESTPIITEPRQLAGDLDQAKHALVVCVDPSVSDRELPGMTMAKSHSAVVTRCAPDQLSQVLSSLRQQRIDADRLPAPTVVLPMGTASDAAYAALEHLPEQFCPDALWLDTSWWGRRARRLKALPGGPAIYVYGHHRSQDLLAHAELGFRTAVEAAQLGREVEISRNLAAPDHPLNDANHPAALLRGELEHALSGSGDHADTALRPSRVLATSTSLTVIGGALTFASSRTLRVAATDVQTWAAATAAPQSPRREAVATVFGSPTPEELSGLVSRGRVPDHVTFIIDDPEFLETTFDAAVLVAKQLIASPTRRGELGKNVWVVVSDSAAPRFMTAWQDLKYGAHERLPLRVLLGDDNPRPLELFDDAPLHAEAEFLPPLRPTPAAARPWANVSAGGDLDHASRVLVICTDSQHPVRMAALRRLLPAGSSEDMVVLRSEPTDLAAALGGVQAIRSETGRAALPVDVLALPRATMDWRKVWQALHDASPTPPGTVWLPEGSVESAAGASTVELPGSVIVATYPTPLTVLPADVLTGIPTTLVSRNQLLPPMLRADLGRAGSSDARSDTPAMPTGDSDSADSGAIDLDAAAPTEAISVDAAPLPGPRPRPGPRPAAPLTPAPVTTASTEPDPWEFVAGASDLAAAAHVVTICEPGKPVRMHLLRQRVVEAMAGEGGDDAAFDDTAVLRCRPRQLPDAIARLSDLAGDRAVTVLAPTGMGSQELRPWLRQVAELSAGPDADLVWSAPDVAIPGFSPAAHYLVRAGGEDADGATGAVHVLSTQMVAAQRTAGLAAGLAPHQLAGVELSDASAVFVACGDWQDDEAALPAPAPDRLGPLEAALGMYPDAAVLQCTPAQLPDVLTGLRILGEGQWLPVTVLAWPGSGADVHEVITEAQAAADGSVPGAPAMLWLSADDAAVLEEPQLGMPAQTSLVVYPVADASIPTDDLNWHLAAMSDCAELAQNVTEDRRQLARSPGALRPVLQEICTAALESRGADADAASALIPADVGVFSDGRALFVTQGSLGTAMVERRITLYPARAQFASFIAEQSPPPVGSVDVAVFGAPKAAGSLTYLVNVGEAPAAVTITVTDPERLELVAGLATGLCDEDRERAVEVVFACERTSEAREVLRRLRLAAGIRQLTVTEQWQLPGGAASEHSASNDFGADAGPEIEPTAVAAVESPAVEVEPSRAEPPAPAQPLVADADGRWALLHQPSVETATHVVVLFTEPGGATAGSAALLATTGEDSTVLARCEPGRLEDLMAELRERYRPDLPTLVATAGGVGARVVFELHGLPAGLRPDAVLLTDKDVRTLSDETSPHAAAEKLLGQLPEPVLLHTYPVANDVPPRKSLLDGLALAGHGSRVRQLVESSDASGLSEELRALGGQLWEQTPLVAAGGGLAVLRGAYAGASKRTIRLVDVGGGALATAADGPRPGGRRADVTIAGALPTELLAELMVGGVSGRVVLALASTDGADEVVRAVAGLPDLARQYGVSVPQVELTFGELPRHTVDGFLSQLPRQAPWLTTPGVAPLPQPTTTAPTAVGAVRSGVSPRPVARPVPVVPPAPAVPPMADVTRVPISDQAVSTARHLHVALAAADSGLDLADACQALSESLPVGDYCELIVAPRHLLGAAWSQVVTALRQQSPARLVAIAAPGSANVVFEALGSVTPQLLPHAVMRPRGEPTLREFDRLLPQWLPRQVHHGAESQWPGAVSFRNLGNLLAHEAAFRPWVQQSHAALKKVTDPRLQAVLDRLRGGTDSVPFNLTVLLPRGVTGDAIGGFALDQGVTWAAATRTLRLQSDVGNYLDQYRRHVAPPGVSDLLVFGEVDDAFIAQLAFKGRRAHELNFVLGDHPAAAAALQAIEAAYDSGRHPDRVRVVLDEDLPAELVERTQRLAERANAGGPEVTRERLTPRGPREQSARPTHDEDLAAVTYRTRSNSTTLVDLDLSPDVPSSPDAPNLAAVVVLAAQRAGEHPEQLAPALARKLPEGVLCRIVAAPAEQLATRWQELHAEYTAAHPGIALTVLVAPRHSAVVRQAMRDTPLDALPHLIAYLRRGESDISAADGTPDWLARRTYKTGNSSWIATGPLQNLVLESVRFTRLHRELSESRQRLAQVEDSDLRSVLAQLRADVLIPTGFDAPLTAPGAPGGEQLSPWVTALAVGGDTTTGLVLARGTPPYLRSTLRRITLQPYDCDVAAMYAAPRGDDWPEMSLFGEVPAETIVRLATANGRPDRLEIVLRDHPSLLAAVEAATTGALGVSPRVGYRIEGKRTERLAHAEEFLRARGLMISSDTAVNAAPDRPGRTPVSVRTRRRIGEFIDLDCSMPRPDAVLGFVVVSTPEAGIDPDTLARGLARELPDGALGRVIVAPVDDVAARWREIHAEYAASHPGIAIGLVAAPVARTAVLQAMEDTPLDELPHMLIARRRHEATAATHVVTPDWFVGRGYKGGTGQWIASNTLRGLRPELLFAAELRAERAEFRRQMAGAPEVADPSLRGVLDRLRADSFVPPGATAPLVAANSPEGGDISPWVTAFAATHAVTGAVTGVVVARGEPPYLAGAGRRITLARGDRNSLDLAAAQAARGCSELAVYGSVSREMLDRLATYGRPSAKVEFVLSQHPSLLATVEAGLGDLSRHPRVSYRIEGERTAGLDSVAEYLRSHNLLVDDTVTEPSDLESGPALEGRARERRVRRSSRPASAAIAPHTVTPSSPARSAGRPSGTSRPSHL